MGLLSGIKKLVKGAVKLVKQAAPIIGGALAGGPLGAIGGGLLGGLFGDGGASKSPSFIPPATAPPVPTVDTAAIQAKKDEEQKRRLRARSYASENKTRGLLGGSSSQDDRVLNRPTLLS